MRSQHPFSSAFSNSFRPIGQLVQTTIPIVQLAIADSLAQKFIGYISSLVVVRYGMRSFHPKFNMCHVILEGNVCIPTAGSQHPVFPGIVCSLPIVHPILAAIVDQK